MKAMILRNRNKLEKNKWGEIVRIIFNLNNS